MIFLLANEFIMAYLKKVEWMIVDEADKLFDNTSAKDSFREQLGKIFKACQNSKLKHALFHRDMQWDNPNARQPPSYSSKVIT